MSEAFVGSVAAGARLGVPRWGVGRCDVRRPPAVGTSPLPVLARPNKSTTVVPSMRIFDWKRRGNETGEVSMGELSIHTLKPAPGSNKRKKRKGRGHSAGQGGACGFGMRGQKSRSGRPQRPGFEGGQTPLHRRLPKLVGRPPGIGHEYTKYSLLKIADLNKAKDGDEVSRESLEQAGIVTKKNKHRLVKVLGGDVELSVKNLTVKAHAFTTSAVSAIEAAGGKIKLLSPTTNEVIYVGDGDDAEDEEESESGSEEEAEAEAETEA